MFRDNAEVHRLQSLKRFYDYHTEIEEQCLEKFKTYCESALNIMNNSNSKKNSKTNKKSNQLELKTLTEVVYFSLLDEWALWLDSKSSLIKQCSLENSNDLKATIIQAVNDDFICKHPIGDVNNCFEVAKAWINSPQTLLTIGTIHMLQNNDSNGLKLADETFDRILNESNDREFGTAEAYYYKACMRMRNFHNMMIDDKKKDKSVKENIKQAIDLFYKSRTIFLHRMQRKQREASLIAKLVEKSTSSSNNLKSCGFANQIEAITKNIQSAISNIDYLIGEPCHEEMFVTKDLSKEKSKNIYKSLERQGVISPVLLSGGTIENWQVNVFKEKYKLSRKQLQVREILN
jgi:hypothetical protein